MDLEIYIYDLNTKILGRVELDDKIVPGYPRWLDNESICFCGYDASTFITGIKYCMNKRTAIYVLKNLTTRPILNMSGQPLMITQDLKDKFIIPPVKISTDPVA